MSPPVILLKGEQSPCLMENLNDYIDATESQAPSSASMIFMKMDPASLYTNYGFLLSMLIIVAAPVVVILLQILVTRGANNNTQARPSSSSFHHRRRIQHILTGVLFYGLSFVLSQFVASVILGIATIIFYGLLKARSVSNTVQENYMKLFGPLLRDRELNLNTLPGAFWFLVGTFIVVSLFEINIARTSLLCLSFGDPIAAMVGISCGGPRLCVCSDGSGNSGSKTLAGCAACFWASFFVAFFSLNNFGPDVWLITGVAATVMEASSCAIDDNVLIPVGTGFVLWLYINHG